MSLTATTTYTLTATGSDGQPVSQGVTVTVPTGGGGGGGSYDPAKLDTNYQPANARFTETLTYGGSDTGLITGVQVTRQLQRDVAAASGVDRGTYSVYSYGYDPLGQLVTANGTFYTDSTMATSVFVDSTTYSYDAHGNRKTYTYDRTVSGQASVKGGWTNAIYQAGTNRLLKTEGGDFVGAPANPGDPQAALAGNGFGYSPDGAVTEIYRNGVQQEMWYDDLRFMRLPTRMVRNTADGRLVETDLDYDMSGTRIHKRDRLRQTTQSENSTDPVKLVSDRDTYYLANGTEVLMEIESKSQLTAGQAAPDRYTAYIFGAGSRLARLSWDNDGQIPALAGRPLGVQNGNFSGGTSGWSVQGATLVADPATPSSRGQVLKVTAGGGNLAVQVLNNLVPGSTAEVWVDAFGPAKLSLGNGIDQTTNTSSASEWRQLTAKLPVLAAGTLTIRLEATDADAYFTRVDARRLPPATLVTGKTNWWPDPGFESVLGQGGGVSYTGTLPSIVDQPWGANREGLHALSVPANSSYLRKVTGLVGGQPYVFSVWKNVGSGWTREVRAAQNAATDGSLTITISQAGLYDQAELIQNDDTPVRESWIPENRLGRVDWFITDHLGSTKLLIDQTGQHRFTGDDDPFGINLRSFGDKDSHRYTGQILDEEQGLYYYGARYYLPEIGRFLSGDPKKEYPSVYVYVGNNPIISVDLTGEEEGDFKPAATPEQMQSHKAIVVHETVSGKMTEKSAKSQNIPVHFVILQNGQVVQLANLGEHRSGTKTDSTSPRIRDWIPKTERAPLKYFIHIELDYNSDKSITLKDAQIKTLAELIINLGTLKGSSLAVFPHREVDRGLGSPHWSAHGDPTDFPIGKFWDQLKAAADKSKFDLRRLSIAAPVVWETPNMWAYDHVFPPRFDGPINPNKNAIPPSKRTKPNN